MKVDLSKLPESPQIVHVVEALRAVHACFDKRFDEAADERAAQSKQITDDRHASKNRDMVLDASIAKLSNQVTVNTKTLGGLKAGQASITKRGLVIVAAADDAKVAARNAVEAAQTAATAAHAVGEKVSTIQTALGLDEKGRKPVALWGARKLVGGMVVWGTGIFFGAKVANAAWPSLVTLAKAFWHLAIK